MSGIAVKNESCVMGCQQAGGQMSGIAALAAAAAATQKIPGTAGVTTTPVSGIKVVTPTIVTPGGVKVTVPGTRQGQGGLTTKIHPFFLSFLSYLLYFCVLLSSVGGVGFLMERFCQ